MVNTLFLQSRILGVALLQTQNQLLILDDLKLSKITADNINQFVIRPP